MTDTRCPTCASPVRVVSADEGTSHYEPVETPGLALDGLQIGDPCPVEGCSSGAFHAELALKHRDQPGLPTRLELAAIIRRVDGNHDLVGAGALANAILAVLALLEPDNE